MAKKQIIYMNKASGEIKFVRTELEGQILGSDWTKIQFTRNQKGERVMRVNFGQFTIDVLPNGVREVVEDGDGNSK